jgi:hypothetical protein
VPLYRLIYRSRSARPIDWDILDDILHRSERNNIANGLSGVLLATTTHFLQVMEGAYEPVNATFMRIVRDPRHDEIRLVEFGLAAERLFSGWSMRGIGLFDFRNELNQRLIGKYGRDGDGPLFPLEPWRALAMAKDVAVMKEDPL